jgi:hypothetical protein
MRAPFLAAVFVCMVSPGCSCGGDDSVGSGPSGSGGAGGDGGAGGGTTTSTTTTSSSSGGGEGGAADNGGPATETVSAGDVATSPGYKMVFTFGQPTQNQGKTTSPGYRMQGGLIGANGSLP